MMQFPISDHTCVFCTCGLSVCNVILLTMPILTVLGCQAYERAYDI